MPLRGLHRCRCEACTDAEDVFPERLPLRHLLKQDKAKVSALRCAALHAAGIHSHGMKGSGLTAVV
eukprot:3729212-Pleurochrysis_carterae.AAC.2